MPAISNSTRVAVRDYDAYLFDADGTLIDTAELIYRSFLFSCRKFGGFDVSWDMVIHHIGLPIREQLEVYLGPHPAEYFEKVAAAHMEYQFSIYRNHLHLFPGISAGLQRLRDRGKRLAIVSSRMRKSLDLYLKKMGIFSLFDAFVTPESTDRHKPDPAPALLALRLLASTQEKSIFVGDAQFDIECGSRAGMDTAFVAWSRNSRETLAIQPTYVIRDMAELLP